MGSTRTRSASGGGRQGSQPLKREEVGWLVLLALPTFALALSITIVSTYLGTLARRYTHHTVAIGAIVGSEGLMALWIPLVVGTWSDMLKTRIGGRLPFVLAGTIPAAVALVLVGLLHGLVGVAVAAAVFFAGYFIAYEPYRAMYPDLIRSQAAGRAQSSQALARGCGTAVALLAGGLLLSVARPLPFLVAACVLAGGCGGFALLAIRRGGGRKAGGDRQGSQHPDLRRAAAQVPRLLAKHAALRAYFVANALWEAALAGLKAFVILYLTIGLHYSLRASSLIIGGVGFVILIGAGFSGKVGDRFGRLEVLVVALIVYGVGFLVPGLTAVRGLIAVSIPFIAIGGGAVMTMAYAILIPLMPDDEHGALTGLYSLSRGTGIVVGPVAAGIAISLSSGAFGSTRGFQAVWLVCAVAIFLSLLFLLRLKRLAADRRELRRA